MRNPKLEAMKWVAIEDLKKRRDEIIFSPFDGVDVSNARSREDIQGAIDYFHIISQDGVIKWTLLDNTVKSLSKSDLENIINGFVLRKAYIFSQYQSLRYAIEMVQSEEEFDELVLEYKTNI